MARRPCDAPSKVGLGSQRELVVDHAGNFYRLAGKFSGGKSRFKSCLHCGIAQNRWTTRCNGGYHLAGFIEHNLNRNRTCGSHSSRRLRIKWRRQIDGCTVENTTGNRFENRAWSRTRWRFVNEYDGKLCVGANRGDSNVDWTRREFRCRGRSRR